MCMHLTSLLAELAALTKAVALVVGGTELRMTY